MAGKIIIIIPFAVMGEKFYYGLQKGALSAPVSGSPGCFQHSHLSFG
jgi:hypothetical protein